MNNRADGPEMIAGLELKTKFLDGCRALIIGMACQSLSDSFRAEVQSAGPTYR